MGPGLDLARPWMAEGHIVSAQCHDPFMAEDQRPTKRSTGAASVLNADIRGGLVRDLKHRGQGRPTAVADEQGAFASLFGRPALPLVVDANWFRSDVLRMCRSGPTKLLTAAEQHFVRLYVAPHVVGEVMKHAAGWTAGTAVSEEQFLATWEQRYLPVLRVVDPPAGALTPGEARRIEELGGKDPDDIPTATLALLLRAPLISSDEAATEAVYGPSASVRDQGELLQLLDAAGHTGQLSELGASAVLGVSGAAYGLWALGRRAARLPAPLLLGAGVLAIAAGLRLPALRREQLRQASSACLELMSELSGIAAEMHTRLGPARPPEPDDAATLEPEPALPRHLMSIMARYPDSQMTITTLTERGRSRDRECAETGVKAALERHAPGTFFEIYQDEWQLGRRIGRSVP